MAEITQKICGVLFPLWSLLKSMTGLSDFLKIIIIQIMIIKIISKICSNHV